MFAQNIEADVERPLRQFNTSRKELQSITRSMDSIQQILRDMDNAHKRADKLKASGRANVDKVATATSSMEDAQGQWDSQAPFVFESLQAVDEARLDHLRGCLTQFQTYSSEVSTAVSAAAEDSLNALLNWQTSVEIQHFTLKAPSSVSQLRERRKSQPPPPASIPTTSNLAPPLPVDDVLSQRSNSRT
jgi:chromosome segregation ATPase